MGELHHQSLVLGANIGDTTWEYRSEVQFQALIMQGFSDSVLGAKKAFLSSLGLEDDVVF